MEQIATPASGPPTPYKKQSVLRYFMLRTALLIVVAAVLYLLGLRGIWWIATAFLISGLISLFVLSSQRDVAAGSLESAFSRLNQRINRAAAAEDDLIEEQSAPRHADDAAAGQHESSESSNASASATSAAGSDSAAGPDSAASAQAEIQPAAASDPRVGVQPASHEVDAEEVDEKSRKGD